MIQIAQWDTDNFGMKVGNLILEDVPSRETFNTEIEEAQKQKYDLLYLKGICLPESYLNENVILADEKVIYSQIINGTKFTSDEHVESYLHKGLDVKLLLLALQSGAHSRFIMDKRIPLYVYLTLYQIWITNSLNGSIATDVLIYKEDKDILGLLTYKITDSCVTIGLVDVDNSTTGKGVGTKLMQTFLSKFPEGTRIEVATQNGNKRACHYYEKNGYKVDSITNIYHIWINNKNE